MSDTEPKQDAESAFEAKLLNRLEAKRREMMLKVTALTVTVGGAICGIVIFWASHEAGVATRTSAIATNTRDLTALKLSVADIKGDLDQFKRDAVGDGKVLARVQQDVEHIKKTLDQLAKRRR